MNLFRVTASVCIGYVFVVIGLMCASESVDVVGLHDRRKMEIYRYQQVSRASVRKIFAIAKSRSLESSGRWHSAVFDAQRALLRLKRGGYVTANIEHWYNDEVVVWNNMKTIGMRLAELNDIVMALSEEVEEDIFRSKNTFRKIVELAKTSKKLIKCVIVDMEEYSTKCDKRKNLLYSEVAKGTNSCNSKDEENEISLLAHRLRKSIDRIEHVGELLKGYIGAKRGEKKEYRKRIGRVGELRKRFAWLQERNIDTDRRGVYYALEKTVELKLRNKIDRYSLLFEEWAGVNEIFLEGGHEIYRKYVLPEVRRFGHVTGRIEALNSSSMDFENSKPECVLEELANILTVEMEKKLQKK